MISSRHSFCLLLVNTNTLHFENNNCEKDMSGVCLWMVTPYSLRETLATTKSAFFSRCFTISKPYTRDITVLSIQEMRALMTKLNSHLLSF